MEGASPFQRGVRREVVDPRELQEGGCFPDKERVCLHNATVLKGYRVMEDAREGGKVYI